MTVTLRWFAPLAVVFGALPALACPVCNSEAGVQVWRGIFDGAFAATLVELFLPFPVLAACVAAAQWLLARAEQGAPR